MARARPGRRMNPLWSYLWPALVAATVVGAIFGTVALRYKEKRKAALAIGLLVSLVLAAAWHWPMSAANRFTSVVERSARITLSNYEMPRIQAHLHTAPLTRRLILSGQADDFQTSELARILST